MSGSEDTDDSDQHDQRSEDTDESGASPDGAPRTADEIEAAGSRLLEWFRGLERKEQIAVVASSLVILDETEDIATATAGIGDDIIATESSDDSRNGSVHHTNEPEVSPPNPYPSPSYDTPESGELDWHVPINENFDTIEDHVRFLSAKTYQLERNYTELAEQSTELRLNRLEMRLDDIEEQMD